MVDKFTDPYLSYFALGLLIFVAVAMFYGIIAIHDIPYRIAEKREHPHADAIHAAGWVSLFMLHALWPFLWIWAMAYRPDRGWGFHHSGSEKAAVADDSEMAELRRRLKELEEKVAAGGKPEVRRRASEGETKVDAKVGAGGE